MSINIKVTPKPIQIKVANLIYQAGANNVTSVNGKKSDVILTASDVGAESIGTVQALSDALQPQINDVVSLAQTNQLNIGNKADQVDLESTNAAVEINRLALLNKTDIAALTTLAQLVDTKADQSYVISEIARITGNAPAALDTLAEIAEQLGNDETQINNLLDQIGKRVRFDAAQALTAPQQTQVRDNINAEAKGVAQSLVSSVTVASIGAATTLQGTKADSALQPSDVSTAGKTGSYNDLTNKPDLTLKQNSLPTNGTAGQFLAHDMTFKTPSGGGGGDGIVWTEVGNLAPEYWQFGFSDGTGKLSFGRDASGNIYIKGVIRCLISIAAKEALFNLSNMHKLKGYSHGGTNTFYNVRYNDLTISTTPSNSYYLMISQGSGLQAIHFSDQMIAGRIYQIPQQCLGLALNP